MASLTDYRLYMDECLRAAAKATSNEERKSLLQLAQTWHEAATRLEAYDKPLGEARQALESSRAEAGNQPWRCALTACAGCEQRRPLLRRRSSKGSAVPGCLRSPRLLRCTILEHLVCKPSLHGVTGCGAAKTESQACRTVYRRKDQAGLYLTQKEERRRLP